MMYFRIMRRDEGLKIKIISNGDVLLQDVLPLFISSNNMIFLDNRKKASNFQESIKEQRR